MQIETHQNNDENKETLEIRYEVKVQNCGFLLIQTILYYKSGK